MTYKYKYRTKSDMDNKNSRNFGEKFYKLPDNVGYFVAKEGLNKIRILPPTHGDMDFWGMLVTVHYGVGPDNSQYLCPRQWDNTWCPVCEKWEQLQQDGADNEILSDYRQSTRVLFYLLDRKDDESEKVRFWSISPTAMTTINDISVYYDEKTGQEDVIYIDHPEDGYDLLFNRRGKGKNDTEYSGYRLDNQKRAIVRGSQDREKILDLIQEHPLDQILIYRDGNYIAKAMGMKKSQHNDNMDDDIPDEKGRVDMSGQNNRTPERKYGRANGENRTPMRRGRRNQKTESIPEKTLDDFVEMYEDELMEFMMDNNAITSEKYHEIIDGVGETDQEWQKFCEKMHNRYKDVLAFGSDIPF